MILLTGATGFIGQHVVAKLQQVRCVVRSDKGHAFNDVFEIDNLDGQTDWSSAFDKVSSIIHLAGLAHNNTKDDSKYISVNTEGTVNLAKAAVAAGVKRFVFVSTIGVNGAVTDHSPFSNQSIPNPHSGYAVSKLNAEVALKKIASESDLEVTIIRPTLVYGPNAPGNFGKLIKLINLSPFLPFGLTNNRRDFISVQNLADLLVTCTHHPKAAGKTFFAADGETVTTQAFTNAIAKGLGKRIFQIPVPPVFARQIGKITGKSEMVEQLFGNLEVDSTETSELLDWNPPFTMAEAMSCLNIIGNE
ncbi:NAD-dependent epimerase/dehydratase family protein [Vibrio breoganii]